MASNDWALDGNAGTDPPINFLGTTDAKPLIFKTNTAEAARLKISHRFGLGTAEPEVRLHVRGNRIRLQSADATRRVDLRADGSALDLQSDGAPLFINNNNGQSTLLNATTGRVGIGTTSPTSRLTVRDTIPAGTPTDRAALECTFTSQVSGQGLVSQTAAIRGINSEGHGYRARARHISVSRVRA
jgi:hypothetical protein